MSIIDVLTGVSLVASIVSLVLAIVAINFSKTAEKDSRGNFERTQKMMLEFYDKTKDVLAEIDKRATVTEKTVTDSQQQLLNTMTSLINETVIPKKQDIGEQLGIKFIEKLMKDPNNAGKMMETLVPLMELSQKQQIKTNDGR